MVHTNEPELNLDELQCAIIDAAMIVARLSLDPNDGYIGPRVILSRIRPTISATRSVRPENITISGINFALSNYVIRKKSVLVAGELDPAHAPEIRTVSKRPLRSIEMRHAQVDKV